MNRAERVMKKYFREEKRRIGAPPVPGGRSPARGHAVRGVPGSLAAAAVLALVFVGLTAPRPPRETAIRLDARILVRDMGAAFLDYRAQATED